MDLYEFCRIVGDEEESFEFLQANGLIRQDAPGDEANTVIIYGFRSYFIEAYLTPFQRVQIQSAWQATSE